MAASSPNRRRRETTPTPVIAAMIGCFLVAGVVGARTSEPTTIRVPGDYASIQQAIDAAAGGDTVLVAPGTYTETIDFRGKNITVTSEQGPQVTIIDGHGANSVASFKMGETRDAVLSGFTLRGGYTNSFGGGGIAILSSSPTIRDNIIRDNQVCSNGGGINSIWGSPLIEHNTITHNGVRGCTGGWGLGVYIYGNSAAEIVGNLITENNDSGIGSVSGGGLALFSAGNPTVRGNVISNNVIVAATGGCSAEGGAIAIANDMHGTIVDNLVVGNKACVAAAVYWIGYASSGGAVFANNTVTANEGRFGAPAIYTAGVDGRTWIANNVITTPAGAALLCNNVATVSMPNLASNDMFRGDAGSPYGGTCADQTGLNGNISADPLFVDAANGDYRVRMMSPVIDAGNDAVPQLPSVDISGTPRVVDGDGDGTAHVDLGAFEYHNHAPTVSAGGDRTVVLSDGCTADVTLTASGSDADGDALTYSWTSAFGTQNGQTLSVSLPPGTYPFTVTTSDGNGGFASDTGVVSVLDTTPPAIASVTATPSVILANDHKMVPVVVTVSAADQCGNAVSCRIVDVTSNEPVDGLGDGDSAPDWEITGPLTLNVRAERSGSGSGRIYTIVIACTDPSGNYSSSAVVVTVPR